MYLSENFKSKAAAKRALADGQVIRLVSNSPYDGTNPNGKVHIEGPWYPEPHKWWGVATAVNGTVIKIQ